jgi:hypothetical protein
MRLKDQSVAKRCEREGANSRLSRRLILCAVLGIGGTLSSFAKPGHGELSIDSIDARISLLQQRVDSFSTVMKKLRDDSAKTVASALSGGSPEAKQLADLDDALAKSRSAAADLKASYDKARTDSIALAAKFHDQLLLLRKTGDSLDKALAGLHAASASHAAHAAPRDSLADQRTMAALQIETARDDSLLHLREKALVAITADIDKVRQDSVAAEKQRKDHRDGFSSRLHALDSQIAISEAEAAKAVASRTGAKAETGRKLAQLQDSIKTITARKQQYLDRISSLNKEVSLLGTERADLAKTAGEDQSRYSALHAPYDSAIAKAEAAIQAASEDKPVLEALKVKIRLDNDITLARELLDKAIQAQASNKKGGQSLVDAREARLDTLLSQRDSIVGTTSGLKDREAGFTAAVQDGGSILPLVDSTLAANAATLSKATADLDAARKNLAQFEQANPPVKGPAPVRLALMDSMITSKKKEAIQLTDLNDSLGIIVEESQKTLNTLNAEGQAANGSADSLIRVKNDEKATLVDNKAKLQHDAFITDSTDVAAMLGVRNRYDALARQKVATQADIDKVSAAGAKARQQLAMLEERNKQASTSATAEKMRADSIAAMQQQQSSELTDAKTKNAQAIAAVQAQLDQQLKSVADPIAKYAAAIAENARTTASLAANRESIKKNAFSGKQSVQDAVRKIAAELAAAGRIVENAQSRITTLKEQRAELVADAGQKKKDQEQAMKEFNDIYSLLADKKLDDASARFKENQQFLKKNLDDDHYKAIRVTIDRMQKVGE